MAIARRRGIQYPSFYTNYDRFFQIAAGFPTPATVGFHAPTAHPYNSTTPAPLARGQLNQAYKDPINPARYNSTAGDQLDGYAFYGIYFQSNVTLSRCALDGYASGIPTYFVLSSEVMPGQPSNTNISIKVSKGSNFSDFHFGTASAVGDSSSDILVNVGVKGNATNEVEWGYLGRKQNSDGSVDFTQIYDQPISSGIDSVGNQYNEYYFANAVPTYKGVTYIGLVYDHAIGVLIRERNAGTSIDLFDFAQNGYVIADYCNFGYEGELFAGGAGLVTATTSRFDHCLIGYKLDTARVTGDLGFKDSLLGPDFGGIALGPHADGFQNVGGAHNYPTSGDIWLDFSNQQQQIADSNSNDLYNNSGYKSGSYKASWAAGAAYSVGDQVVAMHPGPIVATATSAHTSASTYSQDAAHWTESAAELLHMPGKFWTWLYHCSILGYIASISNSYEYVANHAPFFLSSNSNNAGPIQNFLIWNTFMSGGQQSILDNTSVNSDNWNLPVNGGNGIAGPGGFRGIGGVRGMIVGGDSVVQFAPQAGGGPIGSLTANYTDTNSLTLYVNCFIADSTNFKVGSGGDTTQAYGDATYVSSGIYMVNMLTSLNNTHTIGDQIATYSSGLANQSNPSQSQMVPRLSAAINASSSNNSPILQTTNYNYAVMQEVVGTSDSQNRTPSTTIKISSTYSLDPNGDGTDLYVGPGVNGVDAHGNPNIGNAPAPSSITYAPAPTTGRTDAVTISQTSGTVNVDIIDNSITAWDIGKTIIGSKIPIGARVLQVNKSNGTFQITTDGKTAAKPISAGSSTVQIGGAQLTLGQYSDTVTVTNVVSTDSNGTYTVTINQPFNNTYPVTSFYPRHVNVNDPNGNDYYVRTLTDTGTVPHNGMVASDQTSWRELPRTVELSGDLSALNPNYNYWGTVTDQNGNLITLLDALRDNNSGGWKGWPKQGQQAGQWESTSVQPPDNS